MRDPLEGKVHDARQALIAVAVAVVGAVVLGIFNPTALGTVAVIFGIVLMIMIHEAGHYVTAKWSDMLVTEFFLGFGPRLWSMRRGETEYGVKAIPAGGYVRIIGMNNLEEVAPEDEPRTYRAKPYRNRLMVAVAGSFTHFVLAIGLLFLVLAFFGLPEAQPEVDQVVADSPAATSGIQAGDRIVAVDDQPVDQWDDVPDAIRPHEPGDRVVLTVQRGDRTFEVPLTTAEHPDAPGAAFVGVSPTIADVTEPVPGALGQAFTDTGQIAKESVLAVGRFFTPSSLSRYGAALSGDEDPADDTRFLSPVGATQVANQAVREGIREVLLFLALINIFVGTLNMLPLPPLDGGHVAVATYEKIASKVTGRPVQVDMAKIMPIAALVVVVLLFIGISALWLDIVRPVDVGF